MIKESLAEKNLTLSFPHAREASSFLYLFVVIAFFSIANTHAEDTALLSITPDNIPPAFTANYAVEVRGLNLGELEVALTQDNSQHWTYHSVSSAKGLAAVFSGAEPVTDTSKLQLLDGLIRPTFYERIRKTKKADKSERAIYQWENLLAKTSYKDRQTDITLKEDVTDKFTLQLLIMANIHQIPASMTLPVISKAKLKPYQIVNSGPTKIDTVYGEREAIVVERIKDDSSYRIWADPNAHGLPLQIERIKKGRTEYMVYLKETSLIKENKKESATPVTNPQSSYYSPK